MSDAPIPTPATATTPPPMSQEEYLSHWGNQCPKCQGTDIEGGHFESDCAYAWQPIRCLTCGAEWRDLFRLEGYELK